ncbi:MAG: RidA family protein [Deltaproteobacteria bacterium]|nr:MAG: RidA family protein [Deltaproteobacteria bacterium]
MTSEEIRMPGWPAPRGFVYGRVCRGRALHLAGLIGSDDRGAVVPGGLVPQFGRALDNVISVVRAAGGAPEDVASMTIYVTDIAAYRAAVKALGAEWRARLGKHFVATALVAVSGLVDHGAEVEIQATAYLAGEP